MVTKMKKAKKNGGQGRSRSSSAATNTLPGTVKGAVGEASHAMRGVARTGLDAARGVSGKVVSALRSRRTLKAAVGRALVTGGRALIDPRAAVGEMAVRLGEGLLGDEDRLHWFVVRIDDAGHAATYGFIKRSDAQTFYETTREAFPRQYLCECVAGPGG